MAGTTTAGPGAADFTEERFVARLRDEVEDLLADGPP